MDRKNVKLILAYDGARYHGWQRQVNGVTIQQVLEEAIGVMVGAPVTVHGSGRTDAGVHARAQVCNFIHGTRLTPEEFRRGLNSLLPDDILVREAAQVSLDFHSRYRAVGKTYEYRMLQRPEPDIFMRNYLWHIPVPLDISSMRECLSMLVGTHDFSSFKSTGSGTVSSVRTIRTAELRDEGGGRYTVVMEADGFLRHMVRNIVGTVVEVGKGKTSAAGFREIMAACDRSAAGVKAPPQGLFLVAVHY